MRNEFENAYVRVNDYKLTRNCYLSGSFLLFKIMEMEKENLVFEARLLLHAIATVIDLMSEENKFLPIYRQFDKFCYLHYFLNGNANYTCETHMHIVGPNPSQFLRQSSQMTQRS